MNTVLDQFRIKKALIVEDHPDMLEVFTWQLSMMGYSVISANNGMEGVKKATEENPDLILMDIIMPVMGGQEATRLIRSNPVTKDIPILATTVLFRESEQRECIDTGCNGYIGKPFTFEELQEKIQALMLASRTENRIRNISKR
jgi:two-component system alkaline phosphatase synthesis response regulator PhoP